jgi:hypothetical protein
MQVDVGDSSSVGGHEDRLEANGVSVTFGG